MGIDVVLEMVHAAKSFRTDDARTSLVLNESLGMGVSYVFDTVSKAIDFDAAKVAVEVCLGAPINSIRKVFRIHFES